MKKASFTQQEYDELHTPKVHMSAKEVNSNDIKLPPTYMYGWRTDDEVPENSVWRRQENGNHYQHMPIQPTHFSMANGLGFAEGNVIKYVCRHKLKGGASDIKKAIHYLQMILEQEYGEC